MEISDRCFQHRVDISRGKKNTSLTLEYFPNNETKAFYYNSKTPCKYLNVIYWEYCKIYYISRNVRKFY